MNLRAEWLRRSLLLLQIWDGSYGYSTSRSGTAKQHNEDIETAYASNEAGLEQLTMNSHMNTKYDYNVSMNTKYDYTVSMSTKYDYTVSMNTKYDYTVSMNTKYD